jgi:phosphate transport system permease protein
MENSIRKHISRGPEIPVGKETGNRAVARRACPQGRGRNTKEAMEKLMHLLFLLCGIVAVAFVLFISIYLIISGVPAIRQIGLIDFLFGTTWASTAANPSFGILPFILTSIYGTSGAVLIGVPVGLMTAVFLAKVAPPKVSVVIHTAVELLAGIPSVVYGLVGMIVLVPAIQKAFGLSSGACLLAAIVVLAIMILPSIINVSETALRAVPKEYEEASLAMGATWLETVFRVSVPAARSGIATAIVLGVGRAIGEAMAIIMVAGNVANMPGLFTSVRFLTTAIASEMSYAAYGSLQRQALFSIGLVLFLFIMLINVLLNVLIKHKKEG